MAVLTFLKWGWAFQMTDPEGVVHEGSYLRCYIAALYALHDISEDQNAKKGSRIVQLDGPATFVSSKWVSR